MTSVVFNDVNSDVNNDDDDDDDDGDDDNSSITETPRQRAKVKWV